MYSDYAKHDNFQKNIEINFVKLSELLCIYRLVDEVGP